MVDYRKYQKYVDEELTFREKLEAVAEESAELAQAALKMIRAYGMSNNITPTNEEEAGDALIEEVWDLMSCLSIIGGLTSRIPTADSIATYEKWERWAKRLGYQEG
ncbi:MAG: hypothetical protein MJ074_07475 [Oscillospiraceae bacterium]|nr:hypothetical protein [Oscillospiraceae bacterium]